MGKIKTVHLRAQDEEVITYLNSLKNFSEWVRHKARNDMAKQKTGLDPEIAAYIDRMMEVKLAGYTVKADRAQEEAGEVEDSAIKDDIEKMF